MYLAGPDPCSHPCGCFWDDIFERCETTPIYCSYHDNESDCETCGCAWEVELNIKINIADVWRDAIEIWINIGDTWREVVEIWINMGDTWRRIF